MHTTLPRRFYADPDFYRAELERFYFDRWICAGRADQIPNPGDYFTRALADESVIVTRDGSGEIHALFNVCRHRGALVCREREGNTRQFQCIYHGWTYNTDGSVKGIPGDDAYPPGYDKQGKSLTPVARLEHYKDFYFANLDPNAVDLHTYLAGAKDYIDLVVDQSPSGRMEIISGVQEYDIKANWKLLVENSVDDYHLVTTHSTWLNYMRNSGVNVTPTKGHMLPTKGLTLPFVSFGGSSLLVCAAAMGILLSISRKSPGSGNARVPFVSAGPDPEASAMLVTEANFAPDEPAPKPKKKPRARPQSGPKQVLS